MKFGNIQNASKLRPNDQSRHASELHIGAPCCGMNAAICSFFRSVAIHGHDVLAISNGVDGFIHGQIKLLDRKAVWGSVSEGGARIGTRRTLAGENNNMKKFVEQINQMEF